MKNFLANVDYTAVPVPPDFIPSLQTPQQQILWVGCSDSQIIETDTLNVPRQEFFVHRNLGNKLSNGDTSSLSAIELCVEVIQVSCQYPSLRFQPNMGLILAGQAHYRVRTLRLWLDQHSFRHKILRGLALVSTNPAPTAAGPTLDRFLTTLNSSLNDLETVSEDKFGHGSGVEERDRRLVELNVLAEVHWIMQQPSIMKAIRERGLEVHGFVYNPVRNSCVKLEISPANIS
jgi:carbonic anhydrase